MLMEIKKKKRIILEDEASDWLGLQHAVPPTNTKFKLLLLPTQAGIHYTNTYKHRTSFQVYLTFLGLAKWWKSISAAQQNPEILVISSSSI